MTGVVEAAGRWPGFEHVCFRVLTCRCGPKNESFLSVIRQCANSGVEMSDSCRDILNDLDTFLASDRNTLKVNETEKATLIALLTGPTNPDDLPCNMRQASGTDVL